MCNSSSKVLQSCLAGKCFQPLKALLGNCLEVQTKILTMYLEESPEIRTSHGCMIAVVQYNSWSHPDFASVLLRIAADLPWIEYFRDSDYFIWSLPRIPSGFWSSHQSRGCPDFSTTSSSTRVDRMEPSWNSWSIWLISCVFFSTLNESS